MDLNKILEGYKKDIVRSVQELVRIESVRGVPAEGKPYGEGPHQALSYVMDLCRKLGIEAKNLDGQVCFARYGEGGRMLAILVHLDVVPAGDGWDVPPFEGVIRNGAIYGRGTCDDKGPAIAALYALRAVMDTGCPFKNEVRIIFGCDEESGQNLDIAYYKGKERAPDFGFSPDSAYPVINAEKGILHATLTKKPCAGGKGIRILSMQAGKAVNIVPGECLVSLSCPGMEDELMHMLEEAARKQSTVISMQKSRGTVLLQVLGSSAHASRPEDGVNAISHSFLLLSTLPLAGGHNEDAVRALAEKIGLTQHGENIGLDITDKPTGRLTLNPGMLAADGNGFVLKIDIRYPAAASGEFIQSALEAAFSEKFEVAVVQNLDPHYVPEDNTDIRTLLDVYERHTGLPGYCYGVGGGTYAREFSCGVAFGPYLPGEKHLSHMANEHISIKSLMLNARLMAHAIMRLSI
ncbi:MAG: dipeptidase PepV [Bacillota bacterium]|nr:dipeptidase PepV [Bacillota bacterium]